MIKNNKINKNTFKKLEKIAMNASYTLECRGGIEIKNNDLKDFTEISVYAIQEMLEEAYLQGKKDGEKNK